MNGKKFCEALISRNILRISGAQPFHESYKISSFGLLPFPEYLIFCRNLKMPFCHFWVDVTLIIFKTKRHFRIAFCKESSAYSVIFDDMDTIVHIFKKAMPFYYNFVFQVRSASVHRCLCAQHAWNSTRTPTTFSHSQKVHSGRFFHMESIKE